MGLAPYGKTLINFEPFIKLTDDDYSIDSSFFRGYGKSSGRDSANSSLVSRFEPWYSSKLVDLLGSPRHLGVEMNQYYRDVAFSAQYYFEESIKRIIKTHLAQTGLTNLVMAGGCALNCKANYEISKLDKVQSLFIQPAASDRGLSLGSALLLNHSLQENQEYSVQPQIKDVFWGSRYSDQEIEDVLVQTGQKFTKLSNVALDAASQIAVNKVIGWFQGRSEFGPRALGHRSILANPLNPNAKQLVNSKVKYREEFRPFAPAVAIEKCAEIFELHESSPFMTKAVRVKSSWASKLIATTHVDNSARVQTVSKDQDVLFHSLLLELDELIGCPVVLNTSFNVMGEPIVETPRNALATFWSSGIDILYIGPFKISK